MNYTEFTDAILFGKKTVLKAPEVSDDNILLFKSMLKIDKSAEVLLNNVDEPIAFTRVYNYFKQVLTAGVCADCFYAIKTGYTVSGLNTRLLYIINKVFTKDTKYVNRTLWTAYKKMLMYANTISIVDGEEMTVKEVIETFIQRRVSLISNEVRKIKYDDCYEVYIPDVDKIALFPIDIGDMLSQEDCQKLTYSKSLGILLGDVPVRTMNDRIGITKDDFDLRKSV